MYSPSVPAPRRSWCGREDDRGWTCTAPHLHTGDHRFRDVLRTPFMGARSSQENLRLDLKV